MMDLPDHLGDLWDVVVDLLVFYHECCTYCQPWDSETKELFWLSNPYEIVDVVEELVHVVCEVNRHPLPGELGRHPRLLHEAIKEGLDQAPGYCPECGAEWTSEATIGDEWLVSRGTKTADATFLLTQAYWPFLTHYTRPTPHLTGLEVLLKIADERRLRGSSRFIREKRKVVAFTECSPLEVLALLQAQDELDREPSTAGGKPFQWKRSRHDIAIHRGAAIQVGTRPALHGDDNLYRSLPEAERFRFVTFDARRAGHYTDWTFEREFRLQGDLDLDLLDPGRIVLIVQNREEMLRVLARRDVVPYPVMPFDFVFTPDEPYPRRTNRQARVDCRSRPRS